MCLSHSSRGYNFFFFRRPKIPQLSWNVAENVVVVSGFCLFTKFLSSVSVSTVSVPDKRTGKSILTENLLFPIPTKQSNEFGFVLQIYLTSPQGTRSQLLQKRPRDTSKDGFRDWTFLTVHSWGEMAMGQWVLEIETSYTSGTPRVTTNRNRKPFRTRLNARSVAAFCMSTTDSKKNSLFRGGGVSNIHFQLAI